MNICLRNLVMIALISILSINYVIGLDNNIIEYFSNDSRFDCNITDDNDTIEIRCDYPFEFSIVRVDEDVPLCFSENKSRSFSIIKKNILMNKSQEIIIAIRIQDKTWFERMTTSNNNLEHIAVIQDEKCILYVKRAFISLSPKNLKILYPEYSGINILPEYENYTFTIYSISESNISYNIRTSTEEQTKFKKCTLGKENNLKERDVHYSRENESSEKRDLNEDSNIEPEIHENKTKTFDELEKESLARTDVSSYVQNQVNDENSNEDNHSTIFIALTVIIILIASIIAIIHFTRH